MLYIFLLQFNVDIRPIHLKVFNLTENSYVQDTLQLEVVALSGDGNFRVIDTTYIFGGGDTYIPPSTHVIAFNILYKGETFPSRMFVVGRDTVGELQVYDVTHDSSVVKLKSENIGIVRDRGGYRVVEVFFVRNESEYAYRGPSITVELPKRATGVSINTGDNDVIVQKDKATLTPLILPGDGSFALSYVVPIPSFGLKRAGADRYKVMSDSSVPLRVKNASYVGTEDIEGEKIKVWKGNKAIEIYVGTPPSIRETILYASGLIFVLLFGLALFVINYGFKIKSNATFSPNSRDDGES